MQICVICGTLSNPVLVGLVGKSIQGSSFYAWRRKGQEDGLQGLHEKTCCVRPGSSSAMREPSIGLFGAGHMEWRVGLNQGRP